MKNFLTIFDKLMIAVTFAEANEATPLMEPDTTDNSNRSRESLLGKNSNEKRLLNGTLGTKVPV